MGVKTVEKLADRTVIHIHEPTRYGQPDVFRTITIPHDPTLRQRLPTMTRQRFDNPLNDPYGQGVEQMETVEVENVGTLVFVLDMDCDWSSAMFRSGAHSVSGPFLLAEAPALDG